MAYYIMEGIHHPKKFAEGEFAPILKGHQELIRDGIESGVILLAGPQVGTAGGVVVMRADSLEQAEAFFQNDPFKLCGLQEYRFIEFAPHQRNSCVEEWLK